MTYKIYAPNIHLFAFYLINKSSSDSQTDKDDNNKLLLEKYNQICKKFKIQEKLDLKDVAEGSRIALLTGATKDNILLPLKGKLSVNNSKEKTIIGQDKSKVIRITGQACPLQIYDSYALGLNIRIPERENNQKTEDVDLTVFNDFNPDQCFLPSHINSNINSNNRFLGQILLLTAWLPQKEQQDSRLWKEIADQCVQNFLGEKNQDNCPPLYREGQLFDSPIFEYGIPDKSQDYGQIFVWLFLGEEVKANNAKQSDDNCSLFCQEFIDFLNIKTNINSKYYSRAEENFCLFYQYFIDLFLYRQKVIKAYQISRDVYNEIYQGYQNIKQIINETTESQDKLLELKEDPKILPQLDLKYSDLLVDLELYRFTIKTNTHNYFEKLQELQEKLPLDEDLSILSVFSDKIIPNYQEQIKINLSYFGHGFSRLDKAISSIRGIVQIEQAERDRAKEEADRAQDKQAEEQEKTRQLWITFVGTGLAVSGISSQSDAKQPLEAILSKLDLKGSLNCPKPEDQPCLNYSFWFVVFHVFLGLAVGAFAAFIVDRMIHRGSK